MRFARPPPLRYFTPAEANALLAGVRVELDAAAELGRRMKAALESGRPRAELMKDVERLREEAQGHIDRIRERGVEVKGLDVGLLDFPALRDGEMVYLCWRDGEDAIEWWHPLHTGFAGRKRIEEPESARWQWRN